MSNINSRAVDLVVQDMVRKSRDKKYLDDPVLWVRDILGRHLWSKQREIAYSIRDNVRTAVRSSNGTGKGLSVATPILTTSGWSTMGRLRVWDYVYGSEGRPVRVVYKSEVHSIDCYEVVIDDGSVFICDKDHLWETENGTRGMRNLVNAQLPVRLIPRVWKGQERQYSIVSIRPCQTVETQCIKVDADDSVYLIGNGMIPTHNTFLSSALAAWWIAMHDVHDTIVITTAPSFPQIKTNLFSELQARKRDVDRRVQAKELSAAYELPGKINTSGNVAEWKLPDGTQLALGRKPAENDNITTSQGIHRRYVLFIIDEAGGLDPDMFVAAERMTTGADARILAVGNPDRRGSEFFRMFQPDSDWNQIHISAYDTPAFTGEECPEELLRYMPQPDWVERNIRAWGGVDDPRVKISILGEFPDDDASVFFSETAMRNAKSTEITPDGENPTILGVDLSGSGMDESKIYVNRDGRIRKVKSWSQTHALESARIIDKVAREEGATYVNIDNGGLGKPIIENMYDLFPVSERPYKIVEMNGAGDVPDRRRWYNARAWWYDMLREGMLLGEIDLDPDDAPLFEQMGDIGYDFAETGARAGSIVMEKKKDIRSRSGRSPDDLDACVYASFNPETEQEAQKPDTMYTDPEEILGDLMPDYMRAIGGFWL